MLLCCGVVIKKSGSFEAKSKYKEINKKEIGFTYDGRIVECEQIKSGIIRKMSQLTGYYTATSIQQRWGDGDDQK